MTLLGTFGELTKATRRRHGAVGVKNMKIIFVCASARFKKALLKTLREKCIEEWIKAGIEINKAADQHKANNLKFRLASLGRVTNGVDLERPIRRPEAHVHCDDD